MGTSLSLYYGSTRERLHVLNWKKTLVGITITHDQPLHQLEAARATARTLLLFELNTQNCTLGVRKRTWVLFTSYQKPKNFQDFPSHRIFRYMHGVLNIDENKN
jgi:hypothetical protein